jgi:hypothetical protein
MYLTLEQILRSPCKDKLQTVLSSFHSVEDLGIKPPSLDIPIHTLLKDLRTIREGIPDSSSSIQPHDAFTRIDDIIIPLMHIQMITDVIGPLDHPNFMLANDYDVLLSDIKPHELPTRISAIMGVPYLSEAPNCTWPLHGKIVGYNKRLLFTIPVSLGEKSVYVHFILDTGAPATFIAEDVLQALGVEEWELSYKTPKINGVKWAVWVSNQGNHFKGLNLLGMDFLSRIDAHLQVNMENNTTSITMP